MSLSDRLRAARQAARMTQGAMGSRLDPQHTRKNVCKWEHGQTEPNLRTVEQLAAVLGVSPCWLAFGLSQDEARGIAEHCSRIHEEWMRITEGLCRTAK